MSEASTLLQAGTLRRTRSLGDCARPLMALATRLRRSVAVEAEHLQQGLVVGVSRFERDLAEAGFHERDISAASYLLCAWIDELVADTPWAASGPGLLQRFHGEAHTGDKLLRLLSLLAEKPQEHRALLELFHACLSLGLGGSQAQGADATQRMETLRARLYQLLQPAPTSSPDPGGGPALSPSWQAATAGLPTPVRRRQLVALGLLGSAGLLAAYTTSHLVLANRVDAVFASLQQVALAAPPVPAAPAASAPARLAPLLQAELAAGRVQLLEQRHRSVVSVPVQALFSGAQLQLSAEGRALLQRLAAVLAASGGRVVLVGHTDGLDARSARLPSAWHQSFEWAREVAGALAAALPSAQLSVEGAGDVRSPDDAGLPPRRVDIVLYP